MTAINWIRAKAKATASEVFTGDNGVTYRVTRSVYRGTLPNRMAAEVRKELSDLIKTDMQNETLLIGGQYRSQFGNCEYINAVYEIIG